MNVARGQIAEDKPLEVLSEAIHNGAAPSQIRWLVAKHRGSATSTG